MLQNIGKKMTKPSVGKSPFQNGFLFVICFLVYLSTIKSVQFEQYNYTFDVPDIKNNQLYLSKTQKLKIYRGQILNQFLIREPKEIGDVYQVQILSKTQNSTSQQLDDNVIEELNNTSLKGLWFQSFLWPIKQKSYLYSLPKSTPNSTQPTQQIISVANSSPKPNSTDFNHSKVFPLYILLSSGKIQLVQNQFQMLTAKKQYSFFINTNTNSTVNTHSWSDGFLYHKHGRLYLLVQESFYTVSFTQTDNGGNVNRFFTLQNIGIDNVRQVIEDVSDLYAFTQDAAYKIKDQNFYLAIKFSEISSTFNISDGNMIDFTIYNNNFYFLQHPLGIIKYSQQKVFQLLRIQHPQMARKISVYQRTILITYQVGEYHYIQQYQFFPQGKKLFANKIFDYHSNEQVKEVLLYENYMVINRGAQLIFGVHSLNRNFPSKFHTKSQIIMLNFFLDQIYELRSVKLSLFGPPSYLVVGPHEVQLIEFQPNQDNQLQQKWIKVGSQKTGIFQFDVKYTGTCKLNNFYPSEYCSIKNSIQLIVTDVVGQEIHSWWIWVCLTVGGLVVSVIAWILTWKHFVKKQNEFQSLSSSRKSKTNPSITLAVEMQAEKENDEKTEAN